MRPHWLPSPWDEHNQQLVANVHPPNWKNPTPVGRYNLVVIGGGTAGLVAAAGAAGLGAKVALIERHLMGGDCLNLGCVPSKALIRCSRVIKDIEDSTRFGVTAAAGAHADFSRVMERLRSLRARISENDSVGRFSKLGVDVYLGNASFSGPSTIEVEGQQLQFKRAVIASGARAAVPQIPGLREAGYLTNESVFNLTECPRRLAVIGGGPIGCELAQAFRRLGSEVTILHKNDHLLDKEDVDAAQVLQKVFQEENITVITGVSLAKIESSGGQKIIHFEEKGSRREIVADEILLAAGRVPNIEGLNLEKAEVNYDADGVRVSDTLQTTNKNIYAAGDICMRWKFTHAADAAARIVIQNALFLGRKKLSALTMPWCTYTDPEIAHVGLSSQEAEIRGVLVDTYLRQFNHVDRAILDGEEEGFVKILTYRGTDKIAGATIVARHAGEMIGELTLAISHRIGLGALSSVIHSYPTQAEAIKQCGDAYNRTRLTPRAKKILQSWLRWTR